MNSNIKKILKFNHIKAKIEFRPNKIEDWFIMPNVDNVRQIGKVIRYWILKNICKTDAKKIFGSTYLILTKNSANSSNSSNSLNSLGGLKIYKINKKLENEIILWDIFFGIYIYVGIAFVAMSIVRTIISNNIISIIGIIGIIVIFLFAVKNTQ